MRKRKKEKEKEKERARARSREIEREPDREREKERGLESGIKSDSVCAQQERRIEVNTECAGLD